MKILELTGFSIGGCGVWNRVKQESLLLSKKGHEVMVFSSNLVKESDSTASPTEKIDKITIKRFPALMPGRKPLQFLPGGEAFMFWDFKSAWKEAIKFSPDVIICHNYRQNHTLFGLFLGRKLKAKVFLVTHAPFIEGHITRTPPAAISTDFYDFFIGSNTINRFDRVITITNWEEKYLKELGVNPKKIVYIPNGIPKEFFKQKKEKSIKNKILFLGRISPIKDVETLINAISFLKEKVLLEIVGPSEKKYLHQLRELIKKKNLNKRIRILGPIYNISQKIRKIDSSEVFVLPSKREAMPQALIEAMAREKKVISSNNKGSKDIISNKKNGYIFRIGDAEDLASRISLALQASNKIGKRAKKSVEKFSWEKLLVKLNGLI